jgi:hypothetical protein
MEWVRARNIVARLSVDMYSCNPSINLQIGSPEDSEFTQVQTVLAIAALTEGWYVMIPDDGGPQAAFCK